MTPDEYKIILAVLAVLILIAQIILVAFKILEKREAKKFFEEPEKTINKNSNSNPNSNNRLIPGFAQICIEHAKKLVKIETCLKNLFTQREREFKQNEQWKEEVRDNFKRVFDRIELPK